MAPRQLLKCGVSCFSVDRVIRKVIRFAQALSTTMGLTCDRTVGSMNRWTKAVGLASTFRSFV
jgi:hypothetical protein